MKKDFRYDAALLSRASFPAVLEADDRPCIVEITVYRLNAVVHIRKEAETWQHSMK